MLVIRREYFRTECNIYNYWKNHAKSSLSDNGTLVLAFMLKTKQEYEGISVKTNCSLASVTSMYYKTQGKLEMLFVFLPASLLLLDHCMITIRKLEKSNKQKDKKNLAFPQFFLCPPALLTTKVIRLHPDLLKPNLTEALPFHHAFLDALRIKSRLFSRAALHCSTHHLLLLFSFRSSHQKLIHWKQM